MFWPPKRLEGADCLPLLHGRPFSIAHYPTYHYLALRMQALETALQGPGFSQFSDSVLELLMTG
jgi:hypothetical protein